MSTNENQQRPPHLTVLDPHRTSPPDVAYIKTSPRACGDCRYLITVWEWRCAAYGHRETEELRAFGEPCPAWEPKPLPPPRPPQAPLPLGPVALWTLLLLCVAVISYYLLR